VALIDRIFGRKKTLSQLSRSELRKEEILLTKRRDKLFSKIDEIATKKHDIFRQGKQSSSPELRKALAQDFELKTQEQLMSARELNLRSKELMTVARLRLVRENQDGAKAGGRLNLTARDLAKVSTWLESDAVNQEVYGEKLDQLLEIGAESDRDAIDSAGLSKAGGDLMHLWEQLDAGQVEEDDAYQQAEAASRRRVAGATNAAGREPPAEAVATQG
jgi:hypothetical protein